MTSMLEFSGYLRDKRVQSLKCNKRQKSKFIGLVRCQKRKDNFLSLMNQMTEDIFGLVMVLTWGLWAEGER